MKWLNSYRMRLVLVGFVATVVLTSGGAVNAGVVNQAPIADAGSSRYAAQDPAVLDGTGSFDPDGSGPLSYSWRQISGPSVAITNAETATPTISGFVQTDDVQECEFELVVSDGELAGVPATVKVIVVPALTESTMGLENRSFDPNKPTIIYFGGGSSSDPEGLSRGGGGWGSPAWKEKANVISFIRYIADTGLDTLGWSAANTRSFSRCADMIIVFLSAVAPDYQQRIQTLGISLGGAPAIDVALRLNQVYQDARYAVNHVTFLDATVSDLTTKGADFLASPVDGEQCWLDSYASLWGGYYPNALNVGFAIEPSVGLNMNEMHAFARDWYKQSLTRQDANLFNSGVIAGAYWSVVGPGKNLQLASTPGVETYKFRCSWYGDEISAYVDLFDEPKHAGRLPEPVTLIGPLDVGDPNGLLLSCEESKNAVDYELLLGPDPYRVMDYTIVSTTSSPPTKVVSTLPLDETWWTVRVRDAFGSTIYADPVRIKSLSLPIENSSTGVTYNWIQLAIDDADSGDVIVVQPGTYPENIDFKGKNLTVRSIDPEDSATVAATVINGSNLGSVVTFSGGEDASCMLVGFTITGGKAQNGGGIYCGDNSSPSIVSCTITNNSASLRGAGLYIGSSSPTIVNCIFSGNSTPVAGAGMYCEGNSNPVVMNCTFSRNSASFHGGGIFCAGGSATLTNCILWGDIPEEVFNLGGTLVINNSDLQGGFAGEGNIDLDPSFVDPDLADYQLKSQAGRWDPISQDWVMDDLTSPCIDAGDPSTPTELEPSPNGGVVNMGAYGDTIEASKSRTN